jgi:hypothetical protein
MARQGPFWAKEHHGEMTRSVGGGTSNIKYNTSFLSLAQLGATLPQVGDERQAC